MIDTHALGTRLNEMGLEHWIKPLKSLVEQKLCATGHGDYSAWESIVKSLPATSQQERRALLLRLSPWRKGPFEVGDIVIDTEWRSDLKWNRIKDAIASLDGRNVLDVGSGNGYYALQMAAAGAKNVIGVDPTLLFVMQFLAVSQFQRRENVFVVPARLEDLPLPARKFDTTFSMGVLYHRRSPIDHLRELRQTLKPGGQLVLETLYLPGADAYARTPEDRYARMRNVWLLPTVPELEVWLSRTGFRDIAILDTSVTTTEEQRSTEWMAFESLSEALDPDNPMLTIEGWPAPHRVVITATAP